MDSQSSLDDSAPGSLEIGDIQVTGGNRSALVKLDHGIWQFDLVPDDNSTASNITVQVTGANVLSKTFQNSFPDANTVISYAPRHQSSILLRNLTG